MPTPQEYDTQEAAFAKQYDEQQAQKAQETAQAGQPQTFLQKWTAPVGRVTTQILDNAVSGAQLIYDTPGMKKARDVAAGAITGATNIADSVLSHTAGAMAGAADQEDSMAGQKAQAEAGVRDADKAKFGEPIWDHAKSQILDFRDAVQVQDPTLADSLTQGVAQLAIPFAGYSRALSGLHWVAQAAAAGALTDATALGPHDARMADLVALGRHTEGKFGEVLRTLAPDGSALNAYINYLHDRTNETEAEGRFKNVLDGFGVNLVATPLLHSVGMLLKQGTAGLRYMVDNGVPSSGGLVPPQMQRGGPAAARQAMTDPSEGIATEQARKDMEAAAANPNGKRPPLRQGITDPADPLYEQQVRQDMAQHPVEANMESLLDEKAPSPLEKDNAIHSARTLAQTQSDTGGVGSTHALVTSLAAHMDGSTAEGAFYKEVFGKLSGKQLDTKLVGPGTGEHPLQEAVDKGFMGQHKTSSDTTALYDKAFRNNANFAHTLAHESVHAATLKALAAQPDVRESLSQLAQEATVHSNALTRADQYGLKNSSEFVAEAEANPRFQQFLKNAKDAEGRPLWDRYKEIIGGVFGFSGAVITSPLFDKLLTKEKANDKSSS